MQKFALGLALSLFVTLGAGCSVPELPSWSIFPKEIPATDVDLSIEHDIWLEQTSLNPLEKLSKQPTRLVSITEWSPNDHVAFDWSETYDRETAASVEARTEAERATGVGEEANVPEAVFETISLKGSYQSDALDDGQRILLPSEWEQQAIDLSGGPNTIIWLSKKQYDELAATRHTHLAIGMFDAGLQTAANAADAVKGFIAKIQGNDNGGSITDQDVTEIVASAEWGTYTLEWQGNKVKVQTIQAENKFATYTILANPENPLILEVELKAWAYGTEALGMLSDELEISGYSVTAIVSP